MHVNVRQMAVIKCSEYSAVDHTVSANQKTLGKEMSCICVLITSVQSSSVNARVAHFYVLRQETHATPTVYFMIYSEAF